MNTKYSLCAALCALALSGLACAEKAAPAMRTLNIQGETYASACTEQNKTLLRTQLPADAWTLVETLLCEKKSTASHAYITGHIGKTVKYASSSTGGPDATKKTVVNAELIDTLMSEGAAWDAGLSLGKNEIVVKYMPNEACVHSRTLQLSKGTWKIIALGEACD